MWPAPTFIKRLSNAGERRPVSAASACSAADARTVLSVEAMQETDMLVSKVRKTVSKLYVQVLTGTGAGVVVGHFYPDIGSEVKPLGDLFIKLIRMLLAPIIFASVVVGIARMNDLHEAGRVGVKAVLYFEVASTIALVVGM